MTGRQVLHYRIGEQLGAGAMGEVYLAEDTRLGRSVAVKFLPASYQYDPDRRDRFLREASTASSLRSPYIASIYDIGEDDGSSFIVMEYVQGQVLSALLKEGPLPVAEVIDIALQVADALDEAHSLGVIHRDIKSSNLMVTGRGLVKVLDFGLSVNRGNITPPSDSNDVETAALGQATTTGVVLGTVSYMAPEQALGREADHRSDLFSLGVVIYEMLTGRLPFDGQSITEIIDRILHEDPPAIARFNYTAPAELERIVRKTLEKNADYRYQTARELYIDLRNLRRDLESKNRTVNTDRYGNENQPTVTLNQITQSTEPPFAPALPNSVAVMTFSNITKEHGDDWIGSGIAETVTADLKKVKGLSVIGRERVFEVLKNLGSSPLSDVDDDAVAIEIGRRLGTSWILGGGYQRISDLIRITARVVDVATGTVARTVKIDGKITEIFALQDKIVYELSQGINLQLASGEIKEIESHETLSVEAYESFSRGMMNLRTGSRDSLDRAIYFFERAAETDPSYAGALAALSVAYNLKGDFLSIGELHYKAVDVAKKAIAINPQFSMAHQALGSVLVSLELFDEAIASFNQAIRLEPGNAMAHASLGRAYWLGKGLIKEGIEELEKAIAINPESGYAYLQLCNLHVIQGNLDRAEEVARRTIELQEKYISGREGLQIVGAHTKLGYVFYTRKQYDEAIREYERELDFLLSSDHALRDRHLIELDQKLGAAYLRKGLTDSADRHFKRCVKKYEERLAKGADDPFTKYYVACLYALKGESDRAIKLLGETLSHVGEFNRVRAASDPDLESLRGDPRFQALIAPH